MYTHTHLCLYMYINRSNKEITSAENQALLTRTESLFGALCIGLWKARRDI